MESNSLSWTLILSSRAASRLSIVRLRCEYSYRIVSTVIQVLPCFGSEGIFKPESFRYSGERVSVVDFYLGSRLGRLVSITINVELFLIIITLMSLIGSDPDEKGQQAKEEEKAESEESDEIDHYANDSPLPKAKPMDLKAMWLGKTNEVLQKFTIKFNQLKKEQKGLQEGFKIFAENEHKYKLSSLRKIQFKLDRKKLYDEYMQKTRKTIEKINPALFVNIMSYTHQNLFLALAKMRRVSKIFNEIFENDSIQQYLAQKDYLYSDNMENALKSSLVMAKKYVKFYRTFLYYKEMQYTEQIPQNSIMKDFEEAVNWINEIHKLVLEKHSRNFTYYDLMNNFMKRNRVVIGLSSLSLTSLVLVRKAAIIAFSNYLAFNQRERSKEEITKTKYTKVITVVEYEDYRDSLIINTKVSNYLWESYGQNFAVLVTNNMGKKQQDLKVRTWNILIYHRHNEQRAEYIQNLELKDNKFMSTKFDMQFVDDMNICKFATIEYTNWVKMEAEGKCMDVMTSPLDSQGKKVMGKEEGQEFEEQNEEFSYCFLYRFEQYYVVAIPNQFM